MNKRCPKCGEEFRKAARLKQHLQQAHHKGMVKCLECGAWIIERKIRTHIKRKHGIADYRAYLIKHGVIIPRMSNSEIAAWVGKGDNRKTLPKTRVLQGGAPSLGKKK